MSKSEQNIQTFLRIRPSKTPSGYFQVDELEKNSMVFNLPDNFKSEYINNSKLKHGFRFDGIVPMAATQDDVFKKVGVAAVQNALEGFNSTIFAYGQTGSGKTFTLTGGPEKYSDRGIIPRAISMLFNEIRTRTDVQFNAYVSYLELYNEQGYDLLTSSHDTAKMEDLPKVVVLEDGNGNFVMKNLSMHQATSEESALNFLFKGDTNRAIAETPMNMASSRSHCIFTISLEVRVAGSDKIRRSKLNLVDLAGSERVAKTNSSGSVLNEAKYINTSLHFLEMVIKALYEKNTVGRVHIPYRNCLMTSVLRDSLGGNCKTIMVATINPEASHSDESLSTCRFAQRVSMIKNSASVNEDVDADATIKRLKTEILSLREEVAFLKGEAGEGGVMTAQEVNELQGLCNAYCDSADPNAVLNLGSLSLTNIKEAFKMLKAYGKVGRGKGGGQEENEELVAQIKELQSCVMQRDNEIAILVNMVKKGRSAQDVSSSPNQSLPNNEPATSVRREAFLSEESASGAAGAAGMPSKLRATVDRTGDERSQSQPGERSYQESESGEKAYQQFQHQKKNPSNSNGSTKHHMHAAAPSKEEKLIQRALFGVPPPDDRTILEDAGVSFEYFQKKCSSFVAVEENKETLRQKYADAKSMGEKIKHSKDAISYLKASIEAKRRERAMDGIVNSMPEDEKEMVLSENEQEEENHRRAIEQEKVIYSESFEKLRVLKPEIEHIRKLIEKGRANMQSQFDQWYNNILSKSGEALMAGIDAANGNATMDTQSVVSTNSAASESQQKQASAVSVSSVPDRNNGSKSEVNEDIEAFMKAKESMLKMRAANSVRK